MVKSRFIVQRIDYGQSYLHPISFPTISFFPNIDAGNEAYNQYLCKDMWYLFSKPIIQFL